MKKIVGLLAIIILISGCSSRDEKRIEISGSTSVAPVMEKLVKDYETNNKDIHINITADGSSAGIKAAQSHVSDIGMSSRELSKEEKNSNLESKVIAIDAIALILNKENGVSNLTSSQIRKIFSGEITNWKEVGGFDLPIVLVSRENGSGTRSAFEEFIGLLNKDGSSKVDDYSPVIVNSTGAVIENIKQKKGAIGYISLGSISNEIKVVAVDSIIPNKESVKAKKYPLSRDFIVVYEKPNKNVIKVIDYFLSDKGQKVIEENGFVRVK